MVLLFRPGSQVDPRSGPAHRGGRHRKCIKRFHSDGETRRSNQKERREFKTPGTRSPAGSTIGSQQLAM